VFTFNGASNDVTALDAATGKSLLTLSGMDQEVLAVAISGDGKQIVCAGGTATFTAQASSNANDQTVQWQVSTGGPFTSRIWPRRLQFTARVSSEW